MEWNFSRGGKCRRNRPCLSRPARIVYPASMSQSSQSPRSPELMSRHDSALLVVDMQVKLLPAIQMQHHVVWNTRRLIDGAATFEIPVRATEQYPVGLGPTTPDLLARLGEIPEKTMFSCRQGGDL